MAIDIDRFKVAELHAGATSDGADQTCTTVDVGTARRAILIINCTPQSGSDISDVRVYTDASDNTVTHANTQCTLAGGYYYTDAAPTTKNDLTISSNSFTGCGSNATYIVQVEGIKRYVNVVYDGRGTTTTFTAILLAYDFVDSPYEAATSAY